MNPLLAPFATGFRWAVTARSAAYRRGWLASRKLGRPVISVGNLSVGGTGKTPLVALVARLLLDRGWRPAILTLGYGRAAGPALVALAPLAATPPEPREAGDEPVLFSRRLPEVPVVVCGDRYRGGRFAEEHFDVDVHLLDDGFQHLQLRRDVDILTIDATQPLSNSALLPAGRLREPPNALRRAHLIVFTRRDLADSAPLEELASRFNPEARLFHCRTRLRALQELRSGELRPLSTLTGKLAFAFCGVGNSRAFFCDLNRWGIALSGTLAFEDHHLYSARDLESILRKAKKSGASMLVTTEKDFANLPAGWAPWLDTVACIIDAQIDEDEAFAKALFSRLPASP
ncbi:MAG: tetraacyldisaccharide 4'-kinase [Terriglobia bacterium]